jgi:hypothetical protein
MKPTKREAHPDKRGPLRPVGRTRAPVEDGVVGAGVYVPRVFRGTSLPLPIARGRGTCPGVLTRVSVWAGAGLDANQAGSSLGTMARRRAVDDSPETARLLMARPERGDSLRRKPGRPGSTRRGDRGRAFRLETRAGEFMAVARLRGSAPKPKGNRHARSGVNPREERGLQGPGVTAVRPETGRTRRGQRESAGNPAGGPKR